jgi:hypothetical protein
MEKKWKINKFKNISIDLPDEVHRCDLPAIRCGPQA